MSEKIYVGDLVTQLNYEARGILRVLAILGQRVWIAPENQLGYLAHLYQLKKYGPPIEVGDVVVYPANSTYRREVLHLFAYNDSTYAILKYVDEPSPDVAIDVRDLTLAGGTEDV